MEGDIRYIGTIQELLTRREQLFLFLFLYGLEAAAGVGEGEKRGGD